MTTQFIGLKEFRQNISGYTNKARKMAIRFIVLKKNVPVLEVKAIDEKEFTLEKLAGDIAEARKQVKEGKICNQKKIMEEFGLL